MYRQTRGKTALRGPGRMSLQVVVSAGFAAALASGVAASIPGLRRLKTRAEEAAATFNLNATQLPFETADAFRSAFEGVKSHHVQKVGLSAIVMTLILKKYNFKFEGAPFPVLFPIFFAGVFGVYWRSVASVSTSLDSDSLKKMATMSALLALFYQRYYAPRSATPSKVTFPVLFTLIWGMYYNFRVREVPRVLFKRTYFNTQLVERSRLTRVRFSPVVWAVNSHTQTIGLSLVSELDRLWLNNISYSRQELSAYDGNPIFLDWGNRNLPADSPIVVILCGISGNMNDIYVKRLVWLTANCGWRSAVFSYWRLNFSEERDLSVAIDSLHASFPEAPIMLMGFSAGGQLTLNYLQKVPENPVHAAVVVNPAFDLCEMYNHVCNSQQYMYERMMTRQMRKCLKRHLLYDRTLSAEKREKLKNISRSDGDANTLYIQFLKELHGYDEAWFTKHFAGSCGRNMRKIGRPTLVLHAEDDPLMDPSFVPASDCIENENVIMAVTQRGGHLGYHEGIFPMGRAFSDRVALNFFSAVLEVNSQLAYIRDCITKSSK